MKLIFHKLVLLIALTSLSVASGAGCGFTNDKTLPGVTGGAAPAPGVSGAPAVTFSQVNSQIFQPLCTQCHGSGASPDLSSYAGFATNTQWIVPGDPSSSAVYNAVASGSMPQGGPALSSDQLTLMATWIQEGALND